MFLYRKVLPVMFIALLLPMQVRAWWNPVDLFKKSPGLTTLGVATFVAAGFMLCKSWLSSDQANATDEKTIEDVVKPGQQEFDKKFDEIKKIADKTNEPLAVLQDDFLNKISLESTTVRANETEPKSSSALPNFKLFQKALEQKDNKPRIVGSIKSLSLNDGQQIKLFVVIKDSEFKYCVALPAKHLTEKKKWDTTMYKLSIFAVGSVLPKLKLDNKEQKEAMKKELMIFYNYDSGFEKTIK